MKQRFLSLDIIILLACFIISRIILSQFQIRMDYRSINFYWQYFSLENFQHHLIKGVWYNHTQPPVFNLFLGVIIKLFGNQAAFVFPIVFKLITITNVFLLYQTLKLLVSNKTTPLILSLIFMLSPATMIFENELFYTSFVTLLLLTSSYFLLQFSKEQSWRFAWGFLFPLSIACLTRSMYNISWLIVIAITMIFIFRKVALKKLVTVSICCILLTGSWYLKNYFIFGKFTTSTWLGMNLARNVFHDFSMMDSSKIESIEPFSKISTYKPFLSGIREKKFAGKNDIDLLSEYKNGGFINENHISYIEVAEKYAEVSKQYIKDNPEAYLKNIFQSGILFFAPATRYPYAEQQAKKISYYDAVYSFNLSHFAAGKKERRIAIAISATPKIIIYGFTFWLIIITAFHTKELKPINLFILLTFAFVFFVSSLLEHYENMRFRFEIETLFFLLLAQVLDKIWKKKEK